MRNVFLFCVALLSACESTSSDGGVTSAPDTAPNQTVDVPVADTVVILGQDTASEVVDTEQPADGAPDFNSPCTKNEDCTSGYCVLSPNGYVCSQTCIDACPSGFVCKQAAGSGSDIIFLCAPQVQKLCEPCFNDDQCFGGACTTVGDEGRTFCIGPCGAGDVCPTGFECRATPGSDAAIAGSRCWPVTDSCTCDAEHAGNKRTCTETNDFGTCNGVETCDVAGGWSGCSAAVPAAEVCDGIDNDCNGLADDGLPESKPCEVTNADGTCTGLQRCGGSAGWVCDAKTPSAEVCDFVDNDCSGVADDPFVDGQGRYTTVDHCGSCGNSCNGKYLNAAAVACDTSGPSPLCVVTACQTSYFLASKFQCILPPNAVCKPCGSDADCYGSDCIDVLGSSVCAPGCATSAECGDGETCQSGHCLPKNGSCDCGPESDGAKKSCQTTGGLGTCFGYSTCHATTGWSACDAPEAKAETCNGQDDDCNGVIDDGLAAPTCELTVGVCASSVKLCGGGAGWLPCGTAVYPSAYEPKELTCDGQDNDCDGATDESLVGAACQYTLGVCAGTKNLCVGGVFSGCHYGPSHESSETLCDGLDNDCNGLVDDVDLDGDGFVSGTCGGSDCDDGDDGVNPGTAENCATPKDDDCSGKANDRDLDYDGFLAPACGGNDCDDTNPIIHVGALEICGNKKDDDCGGVVDDRDIDGDGHLDAACAGGDDCNDNNPLMHPGQPEICGDGVDNDCDGKAENKDADKDSHVDVGCGGDDCNDGSALAFPGKIEICGDKLDNDCNGSVDDKDKDKDSFLDLACGGADCDDNDLTVHPGFAELCDSKDNDCNGATDDKDADADGHRDLACGGDDCRDNDAYVHPGVREVCGDTGHLDEDCSGKDGDKDSDKDGFFDANPLCLAGGTDCDDDDGLVYPGATEIYDTKDTNCNGIVDEGLVPAGSIIVSEMMIDPNAVLDAVGEWFEVTNVGLLPVNLGSFTFKDKGLPVDSFTIPPTARIIVPAGGTAVLCKNDDATTNGGIACDYAYNNFTLANGTDEVIVMLATTEMDRVEYPAAWTVPVGSSLSLDPNQLTVAGNNVSTSWCSTPSGTLNTLPKGDRGTPGRINPSCTGKPAVTSVTPNNGVDNGGETIIITGSGFTAANAVTIGGVACASFTVLTDNEVQCVTPPGTVGDKTVVVTKGALSGTLTNGYRYTGEAVLKLDYCDVQYPATTSAPADSPTELIYGRVHSPGVTEPAGAPVGVIGQVGYGPVGTDPRNAPGWVWFQAYYNAVCGGEPCGPNDEFVGTVTVGLKGSYAYAYRFTDDAGTNFLYCDVKPGTADGFQVGKLGALTVY